MKLRDYLLIKRKKRISRQCVKGNGDSNKDSLEKNNENEVNSPGEVEGRNLEKGLSIVETKDNATQMQGDRRSYKSGRFCKKYPKSDRNIPK